MKGACLLVLVGLHAALGVSLRDMMLASETNSAPSRWGARTSMAMGTLRTVGQGQTDRLRDGLPER